VSSYHRPPIETPVFRDAAGQIIEYGRRWEDSPPTETYSVDTHPERFAPLHTVADALVAHVAETYDVRITEGPDAAADLLRQSRPFARAVRIEPIDPRCAAITLVYTDYPGIVMHAGLLHDFHFPICGCDACDSTGEAEVDEFERHVFAVVGGRYSESVDEGPDPWVGYSLEYPNGSTSGRGPIGEDLPVARVEAARPILRALSGGWAPWPRVAVES
jgi:hypothetical protein